MFNSVSSSGGASGCIFCSIVEKKIQSKIVFEDDHVIAFLDINPRSRGMTIVVPKKHYSWFNDDLATTGKVMESSVIAADMVSRALSPKSLDIAIIPSKEIQHFHVRIYPVYENQVPLVEGHPIKMNPVELEDVFKSIKSVEPRIPKKEAPVKEEQPPVAEEVSREKDVVEWIRSRIMEA